MPIYRGTGGSADSSTDAYASQIAQYAQTATEKATESENSATESANSASAASTSATNAAASSTNAATSATESATSASNAENTYENFDARYLGSKSSDPSVDNQGNALITGAVYWNSNSAKLKVYDGSSWVVQSGTGTVSSVGGTGTVNGISLSGTVTTDGNLTLGGSLSSILASQLNSQNISQWTNDSNYLTANQTITFTGAITGSGTTSIATTLSTVDGGTY
jgi:hypothetical protein